MIAPTTATTSPGKPGGWIPSAKWICAISSLLLALNLLAVLLLVDLGTTAVATNVAMAILFVIGCMGYLGERKWVILYTQIIVLLLFIGAGLYWLQTRQWIGLLPSILLLLLIFQSNKLASSLKAQPGVSSNSGPAAPPGGSGVTEERHHGADSPDAGGKP